MVISRSFAWWDKRLVLLIAWRHMWQSFSTKSLKKKNPRKKQGVIYSWWSRRELFRLCLHPFGVAIAIAPALSRHLSIEKVARLKPATRSVHLYALAKKNPNPFGLRAIFGGGGGNWTRVRLSAACGSTCLVQSLNLACCNPTDRAHNKRFR